MSGKTDQEKRENQQIINISNEGGYLTTDPKGITRKYRNIMNNMANQFDSIGEMDR